jgi:D-glycero-D-manno-heptose 1,7-bisphosphate phosphatase
VKTVIIAGGKGTRIASVASDIPKPMIPLCGKPILEYQIDCLKSYGLSDITIVVGHLGHIIRDHFGDGSRFNCRIDYYTETEPLGTAGALFKIEQGLGDDFILLNGDIIFDIDFNRILDFHRGRQSMATLAAHPNSHPHDSALLITDDSGRVTGWLNKEDPRRYCKNLVNAGIHVLSSRLLSAFTAAPGRPGRIEKVDLDRDILKPLVSTGNIFAYKTPEYIKDMGTPDRCEQVAGDIETGMVKNRNLRVPQRAVFLDRDGTINKINGFISNPEQFELIDGAAEAIRGINSSGYLAIVITNQPVIARGEASLEDLELIHNKMESELGRHGAFLDDIFFCPHHPDRGFPGERPEYKIDCQCRKPKPGLILEAAKKYNIDLSKSYMAGDDPKDVQAAIASKCIPVYISNKDYGKGVLTFPAIVDFSNSVLHP